MGPHNANIENNDTEVSSEEVPSYQFNALHDSSEEEFDDIDAYELLPQLGEDISALPDIETYESLDEEGSNSGNSGDDDSKTVDAVDSVVDTRDEETRRSDAIALDDERIERIKSLMSAFSLPNSSYPSWASTVPEEEWKHYFENKFCDKKSSN